MKKELGGGKKAMSFRIHWVAYDHLTELVDYYQDIQAVGNVSQTDVIEAGIEALYKQMQASKGNKLSSEQQVLFGMPDPTYRPAGKTGRRKKKPAKPESAAE